MRKQIETVSNMVYEVLVDEPATRDNDQLLWLTVVSENSNFCEQLNSAERASGFLFRIFRNGQVPAFETITRTRRKIQKKHPHLRGKYYHERKLKHEPDVRDWAKTT